MGGAAEEQRALIDTEEDAAPKDELSPLLAVAEEHIDTYLRVAFGDKRPSNSELQTVVLLVNSSIGSGVLNQPYVFKEAGLGAALIIYPIAALATFAGLYLLVDSAHTAGATDYSGLAEHAFGIYGSYLSDIALIMLTYGSLCSYLVAMGGLLSDMIEAWAGEGSIFTSDIFLTLCVGALLLPFCVARHYGSLLLPAAYSLVAVSLVVLLVVIWGPFEGSSDSSDSLVWFTAKGAFAESGSVFFALSCAHATFHATSSMADKSLGTWLRVSAISMGISTLLCAITGLVGYLSFRDATSGEILDNFTSTGSSAFKLLITIHFFLYIPPDMTIFRYSALNLCYAHPNEVSTLVHVASTVLLLASVVFMVVLLYALNLTEGEAFDYVISLTGATAATFVSFLLPGAIAWRIYGAESLKGRVGMFLCALGVVVFVSVPILLFV